VLLVLARCRAFSCLPDPLLPGTASANIDNGLVSSGSIMVRATMLMWLTWLLRLNTVPIVLLRRLFGTWALLLWNCLEGNV
jgi:hypothetical protein